MARRHLRVIHHMIFESKTIVNDLRSKHFACALKKNGIISPVKGNHSRYKSGGVVIGTSHAEHSVVGGYLCKAGGLGQRILRDYRCEEGQ
jgi:hypothetical protein